MRISHIEDPYQRLAVAILHQAYLEAGPQNKAALCFLFEDGAAWLMESIGLDVYEARERLVRGLSKRTLRRCAGPIDNSVTFDTIGVME